MKVKQLMIKDLTAVDASTPVRELIHILDRTGLASVPVVDEEGRVIGIISTHDLVEAALPGYFELMHGSGLQPDVDRFSQRLREIQRDRVDQYMTRDVLKVDEDESDLNVAELMIRKNLKMLPVVNKDGILLGMVRRIDLLKDLL